MKDKTKRLRINWFKILYSTGDKVLIDMFWDYFKKHRISKNRTARLVLLHYYSTASVPVPAQVANAFSFNRDRKAAQFNAYDEDVNFEDLL